MLKIRRWNAAVGRVVACATALLALLARAGAAWDRTPPTALIWCDYPNNHDCMKTAGLAQKRAATWLRGGF